MVSRHHLSRPVTVRASLRIFIVAGVIAVILLAAALWFVDTQISTVSRLQAERHQDTITEQERENAIIAANKAEAFADVAQLACSVVELYPPHTSPFLDKLRKTYGCPPYVAPTGKTNALPTGQPTGHTSGSPTASRTPQADALPVPSPTNMQPSTPSPSPRPTDTPTVTAPPVLDVPSVTCELLGVLCP
jgi:hypothetical protein